MAVTEYTWNPLTDSVIEETDGAGNVLVEYTNEPAPYGPLVSEHRGFESRQYHFDALGSTRALTDDSQTTTDTVAYDAWGVEVTHSGSSVTPFRWNGSFGACLGERGNLSMRHRYYGIREGLWRSVDPNWESEPEGEYVYCTNAPTWRRDPDGRLTVEAGKKLLGTLPCGSAPFIEWIFRLDNPVKRGNGSCWIIQKVTVKCHITDCKGRLIAKGEKPYWEAWPLGLKDVTTSYPGATYTDRASRETAQQQVGYYSQSGEIRVYCGIKDAVLSWKPVVKSIPGTCGTSPGVLRATDNAPDFWSNKNVKVVESGNREFTVTWNCCCTGLPLLPPFVIATASPDE